MADIGGSDQNEKRPVASYEHFLRPRGVCHTLDTQEVGEEAVTATMGNFLRSSSGVLVSLLPGCR